MDASAAAFLLVLISSVLAAYELSVDASNTLQRINGFIENGLV